MDVIGYIISIITGSSLAILGFVRTSGYAALFFLMVLEGSSLPVPSEVVIPAAGLLAAEGVLSLPLAFFAVLFGNVVGIAIDYSVGYFLEKEVVYKHLMRLRIKRSTLDAFDSWFEKHGSFAVFVSRMLPEIRSLMSFPAGFARMDPKRFFFWSILGSMIWDYLLILFGYYALGRTTGVLLGTVIGFFILAVYLLFHYGMKAIRKAQKKK